jgi:hypothetical protein
VTSLDGKKLKVQVRLSATIAQLKVKLEEQCGKPARTMDIATATDEKPLAEGSTVSMAMGEGVSADDGFYMVVSTFLRAPSYNLSHLLPTPQVGDRDWMPMSAQSTAGEFKGAVEAAIQMIKDREQESAEERAKMADTPAGKAIKAAAQAAAMACASIDKVWQDTIAKIDRSVIDPWSAKFRQPRTFPPWVHFNNNQYNEKIVPNRGVRKWKLFIKYHKVGCYKCSHKTNILRLESPL